MNGAPLRVLFASAEFAPLVRVGGLAAAAAGLVAEMRRQGVDVQVVIPDYTGIALENETVRPLAVPAWAGPAVARSGTIAGVGAVTLVDVAHIKRAHPYLQPNGEGWTDNDHRFFAFSAAVAALVVSDQPDIVHLNDWHTATVLGHLVSPPPTVLTIHTLGYQGQSDLGWLQLFGARRDRFGFGGACNPLVGGIRLADLVVAVSPHYAAEITTDAGGFGAAGVLRDKGERLVGILNGIDTGEWDPANDPFVTQHYSAADVGPKSANRSALLAEFGLGAGSGPVIAVVTRLAHQKGVDLVVPIVPYLSRLGARLVVLGSGELALVEALETQVGAHADVVAFRNGYDESLAHRMFAGADLFLMPSRFEPCGLAQMQAMRYGTLPIVTDVGGLHDTVIDIDEHPQLGTGVVVAETTAVGVMDGVHRAARAFAQPRRRAAMQRRGMTIDWSWEQPVRTHIDWYHRLIG